jgi:hypothetical protein
MRNRSLLLWLLAAGLGAGLLVWGYPRAFPFLPPPWTISQAEATAIALERLRDLGEPVKDPYIVTHFNREQLLERRMQLDSAQGPLAPGLARELSKRLVSWEVLVYPSGANRGDWTYIAQLGLDGELQALRLRLDPEASGVPLDLASSRARADAFLAQQGIDLGRYGVPEPRTQQLARRTDTTLRYPDRLAPLRNGSRFGVQVTFAGDRLTGFGPWFDDPEERSLQASQQGVQVAAYLRIISLFVFLAVLGLPFLKRYHEGEIGVRRAVQIFLWVVALGLLETVISSRTNSQDWGLGALTRQQTSWMLVLFSMVFNILPTAVLAFFGWAVGESICRERWGHKMAAFDALFNGQWTNATVARSALRGWGAGLLMAGGLTLLLPLLRPLGILPALSYNFGTDTAWPGLQELVGTLFYGLATVLAVILWFLPAVVRKTGRVVGGLATALVGAVMIPLPVIVIPFSASKGLSYLFALILVVLFLSFDLLSALLAFFVTLVAFSTFPELTAQSSNVQLHGWLALAVLALPLLASLRYIGSGREFVYNYDDVPPHVRRIADRERQRVELETARRIQSSILPDLPPRVAGMDVAHSYLPASEVGGDFYDVLALEDGRLAVAVGDVAGHGVSSGLVMSMAKSALAVQVTFDPEVAAVFRTLNRTIFQSARKRLLATLCYAVIDPKRLEMLYASAGHLYPYRVSADGKVEALESTAYPLGVRGDLQIVPSMVRLLPGDTIFLLSDGVVEARPEGSDDMFGFDRLEESLARHSNRTVEGMRDGVLYDVARFTSNAAREDDQTLLVLRLP